jgi:hypothetical protein
VADKAIRYCLDLNNESRERGLLAMAKFKILASREVFYEFEIEATSEETAEELLAEIVQIKDLEKYAYDWAPLEVFDNKKS